MKKRLLTGTLVASCAGLLVYTAFYHKGVDVGIAQNHKNTHADFKKHTSTTKQKQVDVFTQLVENHKVANDNTAAVVNVPVVNTPQPVKQLAVAANISYKQYSLDSNSAMRITNSQTGTTVSIKPNTFVNEYGEVAEGTVHIAMREMHGAPEFFLASMPLNGFESAGIIELNATADNGDPLFIDNHKPVEVLMASADVNTSYGVYKLGDNMNNWQLKNAGFKVLAPATHKKKQFTESNVSIAAVKGGFHLFKKELCFKLQLNSVMFPEMAAYKDVVWVYTGKGAKSVSQKLLKDLANPYGSRRKGNLFFNYWSDVKVYRNAETGEHRMVFAYGDDKLDIAVKPENMYGYAINPEAMYNEYTAIASTKKVKEQDKVVEEEQTFNPADLAPGFNNVARFVIDECGVWGINRKVHYGYSLNTSISFTDEAGNALNITKLYQYDPKFNTYQQIELGSVMSMWYNGANSNVIFAVTGSNEVALLNKKAFAELVAKANSSYQLSAKLNRRHIETMGDVVALFNS